jgi:exodeoxyribonuclease V beta subunit
LQFDVVFCPFVWSGVTGKDATAVFHDTAHDDRLTMEVGPDIAPVHQLQARKEALAENLRMMYVALTRARKVCYLVWGRINNTEVSAPAYLLHAPKSETDADDWISPLIRKMRTLDDDGLMSELQDLSRRSEGSIVVEPLPGATTSFYVSAEKPIELLDCRTIARTLAGNWRIASFSSLTAAVPVDANEWPDRDPSPAPGPQSTLRSEPFATLFGFPRGAKAGLFFHDLLENWDQADPDRVVRHTLVTAKLKTHGFDRCWEPVVGQMLADLAQMPLKAQDDQFALVQVPKAHRINEMEFYFPLQAASAAELKNLFERYGGQVSDDKAVKQLERLTFAPLRGYMKGYVDTIFRFGGRYYLVDWKSNHLGDEYSDYKPEALNRTMAKDYYFLQYHLYVTALDQLLKQKIDKYEYNRHFGGVFYIFLRGIGPDRTGYTGVYYDRPDPHLVNGLQELLIRKGR